MPVVAGARPNRRAASKSNATTWALGAGAYAASVPDRRDRVERGKTKEPVYLRGRKRLQPAGERVPVTGISRDHQLVNRPKVLSCDLPDR
jgi:hypothetical protein